MFFLKKSYFRIAMWHSRPPRDPPPFMANAILDFHFDYWHTSLSARPLGNSDTIDGIYYVIQHLCNIVMNWGDQHPPPPIPYYVIYGQPLKTFCPSSSLTKTFLNLLVPNHQLSQDTCKKYFWNFKIELPIWNRQSSVLHQKTRSTENVTETLWRSVISRIW